MSRKITPESGQKTEWLSMRFDADGARTLTRVRAWRELNTGEKCSVRGQLIPALIAEAGEALRRGELQLPITRSVPAVSRADEVERVAYEKTEADAAILARISKRLKLEYGQADLVRELIALEGKKLPRLTQ